MPETFFIEHRNIELQVELLDASRVAFDVGNERLILTPSEAGTVSKMLSEVMEFPEEDDHSDWHEMEAEEPEFGWDEDIYNDL
jgi:antitoxin component of MazEF toxin-antitoxin module